MHSNHFVVWSVFTVHVILIILFKGNPPVTRAMTRSTPQFTGVAGVQVDMAGVAR